MAIGTLAAIGIGLAGAGAAASSISRNKAANKALDASNYAADQSAGVLRENYDKSAQALAPWQQSGLAANSAINALLGLPDPAPQPMQNPNALSQFMGGGFNDYGMTSSVYGDSGQMPNMGGFTNSQPMQQGGYVSTQGADPVAAQRAAFDNFRNSTGYQFRLGQGLNAVNSGYAGAGTLKSGAAMKAINDYGQNMATGEFANYMGMLGNQQSLGANAASAQAGVSQNMGNSLANIAMQKGENAANAALSKTSPVGNALSLLGGGLLKMGG